MAGVFLADGSDSAGNAGDSLWWREVVREERVQIRINRKEIIEHLCFLAGLLLIGFMLEAIVDQQVEREIARREQSDD